MQTRILFFLYYRLPEISLKQNEIQFIKHGGMKAEAEFSH
jgi:hypothetical protein